MIQQLPFCLGLTCHTWQFQVLYRGRPSSRALHSLSWQGSIWIFWQSCIWHLVPRHVCLQILPVFLSATETKFAAVLGLICILESSLGASVGDAIVADSSEELSAKNFILEESSDDSWDSLGGIIQLCRKFSKDEPWCIESIRNLNALSLSMARNLLPAFSSQGIFRISDSHFLAQFQAFCLGLESGEELSQLWNSLRIRSIGWTSLTSQGFHNVILE